MQPDKINAELKKKRDRLMRSTLRNAKWTRRWVEVVVVGFMIYVSLPILAPTLMKAGATGPAKALYTLYSPLCHQFAFRSVFLYGEQPFYPRAQAGDSSFTSFDERAAQSETFIALFEAERRKEIATVQSRAVAENYQFTNVAELGEWDNALTFAARKFRGDEQMGYKMALCARDIAIYAAMAIGGFGFLFVRRRLRPVPLLLYALLGLGPIGLDGFSQLLSYPPFELWETRESLPEIRMLTGALFGFMNVWLAFPYLEQSMQESADRMEATVAAILGEEQNEIG